MRVLFVGDVVGEEAVAWPAGRLPRLRQYHELNWIVVNAENAAVTGPSPMDGFGMTEHTVELLLGAGVDAITGGNHSWDGPDADRLLAHPQIVRPANVAESVGQGVLTLKHGVDALTVVNLLSPSAALLGMRAPARAPIWPSWQHLLEHDEPSGTILIDVHGESPWEKASFAAAIDGQAAAVLGTHTHDPTLRGHILPGGTGYVTEVGMTGRLGHTGGGFDPAHFAALLRGEDITALPPYRLATGAFALGAVVITTDPDRPNTVTAIDRVS
ncbi:MAG: YmdB family metallophosphoesterase [Pseudonocardia sp.]